MGPGDSGQGVWGARREEGGRSSSRPTRGDGPWLICEADFWGPKGNCRELRPGTPLPGEGPLSSACHGRLPPALGESDLVVGVAIKISKPRLTSKCRRAKVTGPGCPLFNLSLKKREKGSEGGK